MVITELGVFELRDGEMVLTEIGAGPPSLDTRPAQTLTPDT
jgi:acyl CoA:acetate/3-ketoacid CoA transferase beta subunit